ncbi:MAG: DUF1080 domain-containing protein [Phycisphaeraceae bacterium]|nr:MAG: DUF1080 domain-containing protein [Phycisphaeraceae bacterium]
MFMRRFTMAASLTLGCAAAWADLRLPAVISDGMVLRQQAEVALWGWDTPGQAVTITPSWPGATPATATTGPDGVWRARVRTPAGSGEEHRIEFKGATARTVSGVLIGEVWLASGQSNMEWPVERSSGAREEIAAADFPRVRFFAAENTISLHPAADVAGAWAAGTPANVPGFSAVAYAFARDLHAKLGVPVGIIAADWGGTRVEAWTPETTLATYPDLADDLATMRALRDPNQRAGLSAARQSAWWDGLDRASGVPAGWNSAGFDDAAWAGATLPGLFAGDLAGFDGVVYYRRAIDLPAGWEGAAATLTLGPIDDRDTASINGVKVGSTHDDGRWNVPRSYVVPEGVLKAGLNVIAVRVLDTGGPGGFHGEAGVMALTAAKPGLAPVPLAGAWRFMKGKDAGSLPPFPASAEVSPNTASALYHGMISPLVPYGLSGVIWYQGESNRTSHARYTSLFPRMIEDWRRIFERPGLPFYFVQIAPFRYAGDRGETALLREAQAAALSLPSTGMVVTMDVGNPLDIHPANKREVGRRLGLLALSEVYGSGGFTAKSPTLGSMSLGGGRAVVRFDDAPGGLISRGGPPRHFQLAGDDGVFHGAEATIEGSTVVLSAAAVPAPVHARYAWCDACETNLFSREGLPVAPFRTDRLKPGEWKVSTGPDVRTYRDNDPAFVALYNGDDLAGWVNVNTAPSTWTVGRDEGGEPIIRCTGKPTGILRSERMYENFVLEMEWRHLQSPGNAGLFVWSDAVTARGVPFSRSVEVQVMIGAEADWYTSDGDIFPIHGAVMTPINGRPNGGSRAYPTERRMRPSPEWNHYRVVCENGSISLAVNGKVVTRGHSITPRKGYICLESEGTPIDFRSIRIKPLPSSPEPLAPSLVASADEGFEPLYTGVDLAGWKVTPEHAGSWSPRDWVLAYDGVAPDLWTERSFTDFELIVDWRLPDKPKRDLDVPVILPDGTHQTGPDGAIVTERIKDHGDSGIYLRGSSKAQVNIWCWPVGSGEVWGYRTDPETPADVGAACTPKVRADRPPGQWNRYRITMKGDRLTVVLNDQLVIDQARLPGVPASGPIALQHHGDAIEFANIMVREIK